MRNKAGAIVPYEPAPAQIRLHEGIERQRKAKQPVRIVNLKARQVFVSTAVAGRFFQETAFTAGQHTIVVAHDLKAARNLWSYYDLFSREYKPFGAAPVGAILQPRVVKRDQGEGIIEWENGSWLRIATAENVHTGRSFTVQRLHLSEFSFYRDARTLMAALMQMVPDSLDSMVVVESTANGVGNEFHQLWKEAVDPLSRSGWLALFFGCWEHPWYRRGLPCSKGEFLASLTQEDIELMREYRLDAEQLAWRHWIIATAFGGDDQLFRQEYPSTPEEAFLVSGRPVFSYQHLERMPVIRGAITGRLEEQHIGTSHGISFVPHERGELTVYRKPERGHLYAIGTDTAQGIDAADGKGTADPDFCVAEVFDVDSGEQVSKLRLRCDPSIFGQYVCTLGRWYEWAYLVLDAALVGLATIAEVLRQEYPVGMLYHHQQAPDDLTHMSPQTTLGRVGFKTTAITRPQLISDLGRAIREMSIIIRDPNTVQECRTFVYGTDGKPAGQRGTHDDEVLALGLALIGIEHFPRQLRQQATPRQQAVRVERYGQPVEQSDRGRGRMVRLRR